MLVYNTSLREDMLKKKIKTIIQQLETRKVVFKCWRRKSSKSFWKSSWHSKTNM